MSLFFLLNDPKKDIKVLSIVRSRGFFAPKKINAHGLSNFIESGKNLRNTRLVRSHGFNEPKKVNAHDLSNFRKSGKNLRKTPVWHFFVVVNLYRKDANSNPFTSMKRSKIARRVPFFYEDGICKGNLDLVY